MHTTQSSMIDDCSPTFKNPHKTNHFGLTVYVSEMHTIHN